MGLKQDIAGAEVYIARANRRIGKHRHLIEHSPNRQTVDRARDVIDVLTILLLNVEHQHHRLHTTQTAARLRPRVRKSALNSSCR
jgi:hypothetical protein